MRLTKQEKDWILINEVMINNILNKRIDDLKDLILEVPEEKRENIINFIREYKDGLGMLKELLSNKSSENFTGI